MIDRKDIDRVLCQGKIIYSKNDSYPNADNGFVWIKYADGTFELWYNGTITSTTAPYPTQATCQDFSVVSILGGAYSGGLQGSEAHGLKYTNLSITYANLPRFDGYGGASGTWLCSGYMFGRWKKDY